MEDFWQTDGGLRPQDFVGSTSRRIGFFFFFPGGKLGLKLDLRLQRRICQFDSTASDPLPEFAVPPGLQMLLL